MTVINVSTAAGLYDAIAHAKGGDTIQLAGGNYGALVMNTYSGFNINFPSNVTITSADPLHPATLTGLALSGVSNLTLDGVVCDYTFKPGDQTYAAPFAVYGGQNISVQNCTFNGDVASGLTTADNGFGTGTALTIRGTTHVNVSDNEISNFCRGITVMQSSDVTVAGNDIYNLRMDGMELAQVQGVTIQANYIHDFRGSPTSGDHPDMIQFWTTGTTQPSTNINISGNVLDIGAGTWTQSIFMRNELVETGAAGQSMYYQNISIADNVITNGHTNGIVVGEAAGVSINHNTLLHSDGGNVDGVDSSVEIPRITVATNSTNVAVTGNITAGINGYTNQAGWVISQNAFVQDQTPGAPGYYGDVFVSSSLTAHDGAHVFLALPGGMIDALGAGAAATRDYMPAPGSVAALFQSTEDHAGSMQQRTFDAGLSLTSTGTLPAGTTYQWTFGDGTTASGQKVGHTFPNGGYYDVSLTVTLPGGANDTTYGSIGIQGSTIIQMGSNGIISANDYGAVIALPTSPYASASGIQLGAAGVAAVIGRPYIDDLLLEKDFNIALNLHADSRTSYGEVFRLNGSITASVSTKGAMMVQAYQADGKMVPLTSTGVLMNDLKTHSINIQLHNGILQLLVDGKLASQAAFSGTMQSSGNLDMTFGNQWGQKNFYGDLSGFSIRAGELAPGQGKQILSLGSSGQFHAPGDKVGVALVAHADMSVSTATDLHLGDAGRVATVQTALVSDMIKAHAFNIAMDINADSLASTGTVFRMDGSIAARVTTTGELLVRAFDDAGQLHVLTSTGAHITDKASHAVDIRLDAGALQLWIDGTLSAQTAFAGTLHTTTGTGLNFGNLVAAGNFDGHLTGFDITVMDNNTPDSTPLGFHGSSAWTTTVA